MGNTLALDLAFKGRAEQPLLPGILVKKKERRHNLEKVHTVPYARMRISYCHTLDSSSGYYYMHYYVNGPMVLYIVGKRVYKNGEFLYWFCYYSLAKLSLSLVLG